MAAKYFNQPNAMFAQVRSIAHAAATATEVIGLAIIPCDAEIISIDFIPDGATTGNDTNRTNLNVMNRGILGTGTTELGNLDLATGSDLTAFKREAVYNPSTKLRVVAQSVIAIQFEKVGTGVAVSAGTWIIEFRPMGQIDS